ncbi:hypothetical protein Glove_478g5 [Diversispora epigaea]|uniref:Uncharacterized protein n=1 Tax=Diversispora epigaea TaxID=1348612 RepID=A0A397GPJ9_9GLOM|nr:hypothetical protein Glove_478g5 [Diversispora epigaea]
MSLDQEFTVFSNMNNSKNNNNRPKLFGRNQIGELNYTVKIVCPTTNNNKNLTKKVRFSNFIKISDMDSVDEYDRRGQLGQKEENFKIDVWFTGETLAKTKYNMGKWVNKNIYNPKEVDMALKNVNRKVERSKNNVHECRIIDLTN